MRMETTIISLWQAVAAQDEHKLAQFFTVDARIFWPNTGERFDLPGYLRANCDYPGQWSGQVEKVAEDGSYSVARVWSPEGVTARTVKSISGETGKLSRWWNIGAMLRRPLTGAEGCR